MSETRKPSPDEVKSGAKKEDRIRWSLDIGDAIYRNALEVSMLEKAGIELDSRTANQLIEEGVGYFVADNLEKFHGLDHEKIALALIEDGHGANVGALFVNLDKFQVADKEAIKKKIKEHDEKYGTERVWED